MPGVDMNELAFVAAGVIVSSVVVANVRSRLRRATALVMLCGVVGVAATVVSGEADAARVWLYGAGVRRRRRHLGHLGHLGKVSEADVVRYRIRTSHG
jgi:hypothetical protein